MAIYKKWREIEELEGDDNFLKLRLMVEENQEKLAEFQKLYPELFCDEPVNLCFPKSLIIQEAIKEVLDDENSGADLDDATQYGQKFWTEGCFVFGILLLKLYFDFFKFWLSSELLFEDSELLNKIADFEIDFCAGRSIKIFEKNFIIVDCDPTEQWFMLALADHIDLNS